MAADELRTDWREASASEQATSIACEQSQMRSISTQQKEVLCQPAARPKTSIYTPQRQFYSIVR
jgi:hypothetical protein